LEVRQGRHRDEHQSRSKPHEGPEAFGLKDASKCFHCATVPPFARYLHRKTRSRGAWCGMPDGLDGKNPAFPEPWLCYYCGTCSDKCPRGADPGETMMVMRRYLTSLYDWTGFARNSIPRNDLKLWPSPSWRWRWYWVAPFQHRFQQLEHGASDLNSVWPSHAIELADLGMAAILSFLLLSNVYRCIKAILGDLTFRIPLKLYASEVKELLVHVSRRSGSRSVKTGCSGLFT